MLKKGIAAAGCLAIVAAGWSYAATTWQVQTKLSNTGGTIQVRNKALQTAVGSLVYNNFTTSADIPVTVTAKAGYKLGTIYKGGVAQTLTSDQISSGIYSVSLNKTSGLSQNITASFIASQFTITGTAIGSGSGTVTATPAAVYPGGSSTLTIVPKNNYDVVTQISPSGLTLQDNLGKTVTLPYSGAVYVTLTNIQAPKTVTATFTTASVSAGPDSVVEINKPVTIKGSVAAGDTIAWTQVSGDTVTLTGPTTATPSFTPVAAGTYVFQATESLKGLTDTVQITVASDVAAYMDSTCGGCHNATTGVVPSTANNGWKVSDHKTAGITCITCHTDALMPTPVNTLTVNKDTFTITGASAGNLGDNYCDTCHNGVRAYDHSTGVGVVPTTTCSSCHTPHYFNQIGQNHFAGLATPATGAVADGTSRTAYVTQGATCADCHNPLSNGMNKGYAEGGHGKISDEALNAFTHYDWSAASRTNTTLRGNSNCIRCHTTGGFAQFLGDTAAYTKFKPVAGAQNVLGCQSCHTSNYATGELRTGATPVGLSAPLTSGYFALFSTSGTLVAADKTKITVQFPGFKKSSICIPCHSGRSTDDVFVAVIDQAKALNKNYTTIQTSYYQHAANMGQTFIGKGAYNFDGTDFVGTNNTHANVKNGFTDTQGPCVGCHYSTTDKTHSLEVTAYTEVCGFCHRAGFGATDVEEKKAEFDAGVAVLDALIRTKFAPLQITVGDLAAERAYVRFGRFGAELTGTGYPLAPEVRAKNAYGAWYNWQILATYDKAAFVHNPSLARQILMETIDYVDDAKINGTAEATIAASALTAADKEKAEKYVASNGCAVCHASKDALVATGKHANEVSTHSGTCGRCHTTEGYVAFLATGNSPTGNYTKTALAGNPSFNGLDNAYNGSQNVSCVACHDTHGGTRNVAWTPQPKDTSAAASAQYKLCTSCHNLTDAAGNVMASGLLVNGTQTVAMQQHYKDFYRNIASTHYDLPSTGTVTNVGTTIEGYNIRYNSTTACTDCHGHNFYTNTNGVVASPATEETIQTEWAQSGHAGKILSVKFAAFTTSTGSFNGTTYLKRERSAASNAATQSVGVTGATGIAWEHYDWDDSTKLINAASTTDRQACQKCHTSTGVSNYLNAVATKNAGGDQTVAVAYSAANNDFSHLANWATTKVSPQNELLYCWGCHNNAETGALRVEGNMTLDYKAASTDTSNIVINVPGKGAVCVSCHAGRGNAATLFGASTIDPAAVLSGTTTPKNSATATATHYLGAAASIFAAQTKTGYEFPGRSYAAPVYFEHNTLGCNDCHMGGKNHKFEVVEKDSKGVITEIKSAKCLECHSGTYAMTVSKLKEEERGFSDALAAFNGALVAQGYTYTTAYPYFLFTSADSTKAALKWRTQGDLGAAHNFNFLQREPGAYAHNRFYTKRLIYDSLDWLDNNQMDNSVVIDSLRYPFAAKWLGDARP
ncbi:PKD domain-containing protein [Geomonas propionica]|uniref:Cytochrome c domain-containing protein n=1 Tax=Geomonas propionica TaxID=2798582 RepID=A0ABS0YSV3_9BACT|nr:cytochrome c3 family protein [Geomonas propionica]MBJ6801019.1 hypothetical protein [Geomonas propionica]